MDEIVLSVEGMHCSGCENRIKSVVGGIEGVSEVSADYVSGRVAVRVNGDVDVNEIKNRIEELDFRVV